MNQPNHFFQVLFSTSWPWWAAGFAIGVTAVALAWFTGKRLGVTGGFSDACSLVTGTPSKPMDGGWKMWFILGLPLGGFLANLGHWNWTWLYGRLDELAFGSPVVKVILLLVGGFLIGFGARWAGGCTSGHSIMGVSLGHKMSILSTAMFLAAGIFIAQLLILILRLI